MSWPSVGVVVPTRDRVELLRSTIRAVVGQDYPGSVELVVVYDGTEPDGRLAEEFCAPGRTLRVLRNVRTGGLAGTRNTGLDALGTDLVAFCDDDDTWAPGKLTAQIERLRAEPAAEMVTCAIAVAYGDRSSTRLAGTDSVSHAQLLASRMAMLHSSTFVLRRKPLVEGIGLPDEDIPGSQNEDWDLLLRASARHPIAHVDQPMVDVLWGQSSYFSRQWQTRVSSLLWMLRRHPGISADATGAARVYGQLAFGYAVLGQRRTSVRWATRSLRRRWREPRGLIALAVAARLLPGEFVMATLHRHGHGI
ncbi:MAG: glycosyltransferase [Geodermatophilaceae bacterium]|nr:glycosyltransferase [Geodermatophilaceae bacterium]